MGGVCAPGVLFLSVAFPASISKVQERSKRGVGTSLPSPLDACRAALSLSIDIILYCERETVSFLSVLKICLNEMEGVVSLCEPSANGVTMSAVLGPRCKVLLPGCHNLPPPGQPFLSTHAHCALPVCLLHSPIQDPSSQSPKSSFPKALCLHLHSHTPLP